ncbi:D-amino acid dehydrogenase [Rhodobacterales bacterium 52_120_T64]|nr:D-amino acid dehydrogenase [Rhodobacterales bacterium 52_120_T64]
MSTVKKVAVIGAGITGVTTAYRLAKKGADVTIFESNSYPAMETSYANGGQLSASNAEVWNSASTVVKGVGWMFSAGAPLLMNPKPSWHKYSWLAEFVAAIPNYEKNTVQTVKWALDAREHLVSMAKEEDVRFDREETGILHFYETKKQFAVAEKVSALLKKGGLERQPVTPEEIRKIEPNLKGDIYGGFFTKSDFTGDIHKFSSGLASACKRCGVEMRMSTSVEKLRTANGKIEIFSRFDDNRGSSSPGLAKEVFDSVVVCAGVHSRNLATMLGDRINIYPVKGYSITVNLEDEDNQNAAPRTSLLDDNAKLVTSRLGPTRFRVAGTAEFNGYSKDIVWKRIEPMLKWCHRHFPGMSTESFISWAGLRPMMPNMLPKVGAGNRPGVFYNTGHGHLGWTLSAATAEIVSELVTSEVVT